MKVRSWIKSGTAFVLMFAAAFAVVPTKLLADYESALSAFSRGDTASGVQEMRRLARHGDRRAQFILGKVYLGGVGVTEDHNKAVSWFRKSANQGYPVAQTILGNLYYSGSSILPRDYTEAVKWYRLAAGKGFAEAQYMLGLIYTMGRGVPVDYEKAAQWHRRAAEQGLVRSQAALGALYYRGKGVQRDYVEAYKWYTIAISNGDNVAVHNRSYIEAQMTKEQVSEASRLAQKFKPRKQRLSIGGVSQVSSLSRAAVRDIQLRLLALGYEPGPVDGIPGKKTESAVKAFQKDKGLEPDGLLSKDLHARLKQIAVPVSVGSGFVVNQLGHVVTAYHVVSECDEIRVHLKKEITKASSMAHDKQNDLALVQVTTPIKVSPATFRDLQSLRLGEDTLVAGFPMSRKYLNVSVGSLNALAGLDDNPNFFQMSAPMQSGYSGGPVLDRKGNVMGVAVLAAAAAEKHGVILQNVNWATKSDVIRSFLRGEGIELLPAVDGKQLTNPEIAQVAREFTVAVECLRREIPSISRK